MLLNIDDMCVMPDLLPARASEQGNWASEASPTLGCSIEISRDIYKTYYTGQRVI